METETKEQSQEPQALPGLIEGRIVHYVMPTDREVQLQHRPAVIVRIWDHGQGTVNLQVFTDGDNDGVCAAGETWWRTSIRYSEKMEPNTWHWIERA
jgi:hypothetical protein